jgi:transposase-like protein
MAKKRSRPEEIVSKLRQVEVLQSQEMVAADAIRQIGVSEVTYYRWRKEGGGMGAGQLKRLKELEKEIKRLRRAVSDLTLDKLILTEAAIRSSFAAKDTAVEVVPLNPGAGVETALGV